MKRKEESANSFTVDVDLLQKYAYKASVRDLNAQFQRMGGHVTFKHSKSGHKVKLSHPNADYLQEFKSKLCREIGLIKSGEAPDGAAPASDGAALEPGEPTEAETSAGEPAVREPAVREAPEEAPEEAVGKQPPTTKTEASHTKPEPADDDIDDRAQPLLDGLEADDIEAAKAIIEEALATGAVDDGMIIRHAYQNDYPKPQINALRQVLQSSVCAFKKGCKFRRRTLKFEDVMQGCCGVRERCNAYRGILADYYPPWRENIEQMYGPFMNVNLRVIGKISQYRRRKGKTGHRWDLLLYDTVFVRVDDGESDEDGTETRKLWVRVPQETYDRFNLEYEFRREDIIAVTGTLKWYDNYCNYQLTAISEMELVERKGETIIQPVDA